MDNYILCNKEPDELDKAIGMDKKNSYIKNKKIKKTGGGSPRVVRSKARLGDPRRSGTTQQPIQWEWIEGGACDELTASSSEASTREAS